MIELKAGSHVDAIQQMLNVIDSLTWMHTDITKCATGAAYKGSCREAMKRLARLEWREEHKFNNLTDIKFTEMDIVGANWHQDGNNFHNTSPQRKAIMANSEECADMTQQNSNQIDSLSRAVTMTW